MIDFFRARWHAVFGHTTLSYSRQAGPYWFCYRCDTVVHDFSAAVLVEFERQIDALQTENDKLRERVKEVASQRDHFKQHNATAQGVAKTERAEKKALNKKLDAAYETVEAFEESMTATGFGLTQDLLISRREVRRLKQQVRRLETRLESERQLGRIL